MRSSDRRPHLVVVGGGLAGLTAAWEAQRRGCEVTLLEADARLGGKLHTQYVDDLLIDTGPDSFLSSKPPGLRLISDLGLLDQVINTLPDGGGTFILRNGQLQPLPEGMTLLVPADLRAIAKTPLVSPLGKARMALDLLLPPRAGNDDESVATFVRRRVGREAFERMAEPLLSGIYGGNAEQLSLLATFPRLRDTERAHGGVIRGAIEQKRAVTAAVANAPASTTAPKRSPFVSLRNGLQTLVDTLEQQIGPEHIHRNEPVQRLERTSGGWRMETAQRTLEADGVLLAIPAFAAATLLQPIDAALAAPLRGIPYGSSATVSMAYHLADVEGLARGRGFVIPRREGRTLTAVTWTSRKFGGRAGSATALLRGFVGRVGGERALELDDDGIVALVRRELRDLLDITAEPQLARVFRWERGMPQPNLGHLPRLDAINARVALLAGLGLTGAAYRGVGIPDVIDDARTQAARLAETLLSTSANSHTSDQASTQEETPTSSA